MTAHQPARRPDPRGLRLWVNGEIFDDSAEATVSVVDHGLVVGDGVFEALKVTDQGAFAVTRHLRRMSRSANSLRLPDPDHDVVRRAIEEVIQGRDWQFGKVRITWTGGQGPLGSGEPYGSPTLVVAAHADEPPAPSTRIVTTPWVRNESGALAGVKSTSYAENVLGLAHAHDEDATEGIFHNVAGNVCEGTGSNIFFVLGDRTVTPPLSAGCLAGITRDLLLEWTDIVEDDITPEAARAADEVFITSSLRDVQAVTSWDDLTFEHGPRTKEIAEVFAERSEADPDPQ